MINKINTISNLNFSQNVMFKGMKTKTKHENPTPQSSHVTVPLGNIFGTIIHKRHNSSLEEIFLQASNGKNCKVDEWTKAHSYQGVNRPDKTWVAAINPSEVLNRSLEDAINSNLTLVYGDKVPKKIPHNIKTPNYSDDWARHANYIEINNRALGEMKGNRTTSGIIGAIKMLPLIPPSADKWANCVLISQLYPNIYGDGWNNNGENSLYGIKLDYERISDNIGSIKIGNKIFTPEEQVRAFNDLAHLRGLKTSFRMLISEDQIKLGDSGQFRWNNPEHVEAFIIACCKGIELGFDGIFFDSLKHVGNYDMGHYAGVGAVPSYSQMQYILDEIRKRTGRFDLGFSGEKAENDYTRYKNMGVNAGASQMNAKSYDEVLKNSIKQKFNQDFAWGPVVSDDNDEGLTTYEERLARIANSLFGYENSYDKLPSFMQMHDLFPLNYETNTHELMLQNVNLSTDGSAKSHYDNLFANGDREKFYRHQVAEKFAYVYDYNP